MFYKDKKAPELKRRWQCGVCFPAEAKRGVGREVTRTMKYYGEEDARAIDRCILSAFTKASGDVIIILKVSGGNGRRAVLLTPERVTYLGRKRSGNPGAIQFSKKAKM
ncbi:hypothetical protein KAV67_00305 [Candidatus Bipolaricaulota bacterium]|nr:hypothetical protein [Candidatus Bipolaricaulota bacterium]